MTSDEWSTLPWADRVDVLDPYLPGAIESPRGDYLLWRDDGISILRGPAIEDADGSEPYLKVRWVRRDEHGKVVEYIKLETSENIRPSEMLREIQALANAAMRYPADD